MTTTNESCCLNWKFCRIVGLSIGWLGVLANCGLIYGLCQHREVGYTLHETIIAFLPGNSLNLSSFRSFHFSQRAR